MSRWLNTLSLPLRVLILIIALGTSVFFVVGILGMAATTFERLSGFFENERQQADVAQEDTSLGEDEYLSLVEQVQNNSVEGMRESDAKLSHYDSITSDGLKTMKNTYDTLGEYSSQLDTLEPPQKYQKHYEVFRAAIADLYQASKLAYSLAADPSSVSKSGLDKYHSYVNEADSNLQLSNTILGQNYETLEGVQENGLEGSSTTTIDGTTVEQLFDSSYKRYVNVHAGAEAGQAHPPGIACADLDPSVGGGGTRTLALTASRNSGISGTATFEDTKGGVKVTLYVRGLPQVGVEHLAHIHEDATCQDERNDNGGPIEYPLESIKAGSTQP
jgi:hypothetical protein